MTDDTLSIARQMTAQDFAIRFRSGVVVDPKDGRYTVKVDGIRYEWDLRGLAFRAWYDEKLYAEVMHGRNKALYSGKSAQNGAKKEPAPPRNGTVRATVYRVRGAGRRKGVGHR